MADPPTKAESVRRSLTPQDPRRATPVNDHRKAQHNTGPRGRVETSQRSGRPKRQTASMRNPSDNVKSLAILCHERNVVVGIVERFQLPGLDCALQNPLDLADQT